jgi:glycosyltransferase involved in cell wall biosynthesis
MFSLIVATLLRPSYSVLLSSVRSQTYRNFEFHGRSDPPNEYVARNRAANEARGDYLVFTDDDCVLRQDHLAKLARAIRLSDYPAALGGPLHGNMWGVGAMDLNEPSWGVGANMVIRRETFLKLHGFKEDWGLGHPVRGWRADTDMWWRIEDLGPGAIAWVPDLVVDHPGLMGSQFIPEVEDVFVRAWKTRVIERFIPVDPRLQQFLLQTQDLTVAEYRKVVAARITLRSKMPGLPVLPEEREV